jgi:oligogalacturonide transporter
MGDAGAGGGDLARFRLSRATHAVLMGEIEHLRSGIAIRHRKPRAKWSGPDRLVLRRLWGKNPVGGKL